MKPQPHGGRAGGHVDARCRAHSQHRLSPASSKQINCRNIAASNPAATQIRRPPANSTSNVASPANADATGARSTRSTPTRGTEDRLRRAASPSVNSFGRQPLAVLAQYGHLQSMLATCVMPLFILQNQPLRFLTAAPYPTTLHCPCFAHKSSSSVCCRKDAFARRRTRNVDELVDAIVRSSPEKRHGRILQSDLPPFLR